MSRENGRKRMSEKVFSEVKRFSEVGVEVKQIAVLVGKSETVVRQIKAANFDAERYYEILNEKNRRHYAKKVGLNSKIEQETAQPEPVQLAKLETEQEVIIVLERVCELQRELIGLIGRNNELLAQVVKRMEEPFVISAYKEQGKRFHWSK